AVRLAKDLSPHTSHLSLDDFYRDCSHLPGARRVEVNFDDPAAIDWELFSAVVRECRAGRELHVPRYDFVTHTRRPEREIWKPRRFVFIEGLWLLRPAAIRPLFDLRIFVDCPEPLRWARRLARDTAA